DVPISLPQRHPVCSQRLLVRKREGFSWAAEPVSVHIDVDRSSGDIPCEYPFGGLHHIAAVREFALQEPRRYARRDPTHVAKSRASTFVRASSGRRRDTATSGTTLDMRPRSRRDARLET